MATSEAQAIKRAFAEARRRFPEISDEDQLLDAVADILQEWREDCAADRNPYGDPEDTPCFENGRDNCDDWGTGEGRFHGRV